MCTSRSVKKQQAEWCTQSKFLENKGIPILFCCMNLCLCGKFCQTHLNCGSFRGFFYRKWISSTASFEVPSHVAPNNLYSPQKWILEHILETFTTHMHISLSLSLSFFRILFCFALILLLSVHSICYNGFYFELSAWTLFIQWNCDLN